MLSNPNVIVLLLAMAFLGVLAEIASPAIEISGVIAVFCLVLATVGLFSLGVNWLGLIPILIAMFVAILSFKFEPDWLFILLGMAGFGVGCLVLFNSPGSRSTPVSLVLVGMASVGIAGAFYLVRTVTKEIEFLPAGVGAETLVGKEGRASRDFRPNGSVIVGGEEWSAMLELSDQEIEVGDRVIVTGVEGIRLKVRLVEGNGS